MERRTQTLNLHAKRLRRDETDAERKLWIHLRSRPTKGFKFRRQQPIGRYIVDFFCPEKRLVIELDGGHHAGQVEADQRRTDFLIKAGYRVLRFWDNEVLTEPESVLQKITDELNHPSLQPSLFDPLQLESNGYPGGEGVAKKTPHPHPLCSTHCNWSAMGAPGARESQREPLTPTLSVRPIAIGAQWVPRGRGKDHGA